MKKTTAEFEKSSSASLPSLSPTEPSLLFSWPLPDSHLTDKCLFRLMALTVPIYRSCFISKANQQPSVSSNTAAPSSRMDNKANRASFRTTPLTQTISHRKANNACCISQNHRDTPHYSSDLNHHLPVLHLSYRNSLLKQAVTVKAAKTSAMARGLRLSPVLLSVSRHSARIPCATY